VWAALVALAAWVVWAALAVLVALVALAAQVVLADQAVLAAWAGQVVLAGPVVPSPRAVEEPGRTTPRIEAEPPTPTSGPPTSSVVKPGVNRGREVPGPATVLPVTVRGQVVLGQETGPPAVRGSGAVPAEVIGFPMQAAAAAAIR